MSVPAYSALVLAGGSARRFGGADKGLQQLAGRPLIEHALAALAAQAPPPAEVLISANRHLDAYGAYGHPVLSDSLPGFQGPLAGLAEGLAHARHDWLVTMPCDVARLPADFVARLFSERHGDKTDAVIACDAHSLHPTLALLNRRVLPQLIEFLSGDSRRLRDWLAGLHTREAFFTEPFPNLNTPEALAALDTERR